MFSSRIRDIMAFAAQRQREICGHWEIEIVGRIAKISGQGPFVACGFGDELIMGRRNRMKTLLLKLHR